jgi:hypothetical protein
MAPQKRRILGFVAAVLVLGSVVGFNLVRENRKRVEVQTQLRRIGRAACYASRLSVTRTRAEGAAMGQARR